MTRNDTIAFLTCVLPDEGYYCATIFDTARPRPGIDKPRQKFFQIIDDLADFLLASDQRGRTVYHACASYIEPINRKQSNARFSRALWLDIDTREGKPSAPYADKQEAAEAVMVFCRAMDLPDPLFVDSGGGIHCYWPFDQALTPADWGLLANGLKAACVRHGLQIDPARTADIASILRTPGTHNRKNGEILVQASDVRRYPISAFSHLRDAAPATRAQAPARNLGNPKSGAGAGAGVSRNGRSPILDRVNSTTAYPTVFADDIANRCAQIDALRQSGGVEGWFLRVGVLAFCADGDLKAHEWSEHDYPGYDPAVVDDRLARSRALTGATTCARLDGASPGVCQRCPFWEKITSPINIPMGPTPAVVQLQRTERTPFNGRAINGATFNGHAFSPVIGGIELPQLKKPFRWSAEGKMLFETESGKDGTDVEVTISDFPVYLDTVQTGELEATRFSYRLLRWLPHEGWKEVVIDAKAMFGAAGSAELADRGVVLHEYKYFLNYLRRAVTEFHDEEKTHLRYDQFGWKNDNSSFLFGKHLYTAGGPVESIGAKEVQTRSQWIGPRRGGSLHGWTEAADSLFAADMEAYSAVVLASFAAPLMRFQSADEGGAIIHLFTPGSGQGKTTALAGAWTVWGTRDGLSLTNDDTRVSKPIAIGTLANLPVIYDELRDKDPEVIKRMVVMFTEGRDRMRGMTDGTIRHTKANWQTIMLSAANTSLLDQLQGEGVDAPAFRVLELSSQLPRMIDKTKGDRLTRLMSENAGHAGDAYLRYLTQPEVLSWTRQALESWTEEIWKATRLDSAHRFRVRAVGAIAVASAIVKKLELLHFNTDRIVEWLMGQLGSTLNVGTVSSTVNTEHATQSFGAFINAHLGEVLIVPDRFKPKQQTMVPIRAPLHRLSMRYELATRRVFIAESTFRDWAIEKGMSPRHVLAELERSQVIIARKRAITLSAGTNIPGAQVLCIEANADHPVMSGLVTSVENLQPDDRVVNRLS